MTHYDQNMKPGTAINAIEKVSDASGFSISGSLKARTTLERCVDQQNSNAKDIDNISNRINQLIDRLRGSSAKACGGSSKDEAAREHKGVLGEHALALEYDARRLGEIMADLTALEELL